MTEGGPGDDEQTEATTDRGGGGRRGWVMVHDSLVLPAYFSANSGVAIRDKFVSYTANPTFQAGKSISSESPDNLKTVVFVGVPRWFVMFGLIAPCCPTGATATGEQFKVWAGAA